MEFEQVTTSFEYDDMIVKCEVCGHEREDCDGLPIKCPKCGHVPEVDIIGVGDFTDEQLGKKLGKYSYCDMCDELTLNVTGTTYCDKPFQRGEDGNKFFACSECGREKFWQWQHCPKCDYPDSVIIEYTKAVYNYGASMEFGECYDWTELHKCLMCGDEHWVSNGNC